MHDITNYPRIKIFIDPSLTNVNGPEIHWAWRTILTGIGWGWEEVSINDHCDLAYVCNPTSAPLAKLCIRADSLAWKQPELKYLDRVHNVDTLKYLGFNDDFDHSHPIQSSENQVFCSHDIIFDFFWLVTGQEEQRYPKDKHGFFDLSGTSFLKNRVFTQALATQFGIWIRETLTGLGCAPPIPRWPEGKRAAISAGHDVDYPEVKRFIEPLRIVNRLGKRGVGPALEVLTGKRHHWQFSTWVDFERRLGTQSAFYFVARQGSLWEYATGVPDTFYDITSKRFRELFRFLLENDYEIGLHTSYLAFQSVDTLIAEKQRLEAVCGCSIVGNRHHYWHMDPNDPEASLLLHEQAGFQYDSSIIHNRYLGWRRSLSLPFFPFHQKLRRQMNTLQLPIAWMDDQLFGFRDDNPGDRQKLLHELADLAIDQGGCLVIDIHDYVFDPVLFPEWAQTYRDLWEYLIGINECWFAKPAQIVQHWIRRCSDLIKSSTGLDKGVH